MSAATVSPGVMGVDSEARVRPRSPRPSATVVSIDAARRRLRGEGGLEAAIARHPASGVSVAVEMLADTPSPAKVADVDFAVVMRTLLKAVVGLLLCAAVFAFALGAGLLLRPAEFNGETWVHSVSQGESVWGLAESLGLSRPLETVVEDIYTLNALTSATLQPGQQLVLPAE